MNKSSILRQVCSYPVLEQAWQRVLENHGCRGSDGVTIESFERKSEFFLVQLSSDIHSRSYHPYPLLRFSIPKKIPGYVRYLSVPAVRDRIAQTAMYLVTRDIFEKEFEDQSHAYREGRGVLTAVADIKKWRDKGYRYAVDADIEGFFDSVSHDLLMNKLKQIIHDSHVLELFEKWIKVEIYDGKRIWKINKGIPQGSVVSPILANLFLDELDEMLMSFDKKLVRYADDFLILGKTQDDAYDNIDLADMILNDLDLDLNMTKTKVVSFDKGFKFLGAIFLYNDVYYPEPKKQKRMGNVKLPPPLTLKRYLELKDF